jgi:phosphatidylserine/phosphatidylglycerophosphate/cardiolipin synthase-like enzyme
MRDGQHIEPATSGSYPLREGNLVRPLVDGGPAFERICTAVEAAQHSAWITVAFLEQATRMPGGRGGFFDLLDAAAARGIEIRVLFWSEPDIDRMIKGAEHFAGDAGNRALLESRNTAWLARWDRFAKHCHHQKSWVVDAGREGALAFVGGINLDSGSISWPGHSAPAGTADANKRNDSHNIHDVYLEIHGPAVADVAHNFVQRWNQASERHDSCGAWPDLSLANDLEFPLALPAAAGNVPVQVTRSVQASLYSNGHAAPGAPGYAIENGETSIREQYTRAIEGAREAIYIENQMLICPQVIEELSAAMQRGVLVAALVPELPMPEIAAARDNPLAKPVFEALGRLGEHENFTLAAPMVSINGRAPEHVYVHSKMMLVDDCFTTIGSCNTMARSFLGDTELNASFWDKSVTRALRCELLGEQLGRDTAGLEVTAALRLFAKTARANRRRLEAGKPLSGMAVALDPARWGL